MALSNKFIHHVFFWLQNPSSQADRASLVEGLTKLSKVKTIREFHIGQPANTHRDVIERSYSLSWLVSFDGPEDQDSYQVDPIHLDFVKVCSHLWARVLVYDSISQ
jgi:Stress responsive A/B Barrel Domain